MSDVNVIDLTPSPVTALRKVVPGVNYDQYQRIMELEHEISCLKQHISELTMEKLVLKVALEARYQNDPHEVAAGMSQEAARYAAHRARNASAFVTPSSLGAHLRATYEELVKGPVPESIAEFIKEIEDGQRPSAAKQSFIGQVLWALTPMRFVRSGR